MPKNVSKLTPSPVWRLGELNCAAIERDQQALVSRLLCGDVDASDCFVRTYRPRLSRLVRRYLRNQADVEEAVQDTFLQAFRALPRFRGTSGLHTWLHRIAVNRALMQIRTRSRRLEMSLDDADGVASTLPWRGDSSEVRVVAEQARERLRSAVASLSTRHREVVSLLYTEDLPIVEVAGRLGISRNAVKIRVLRARRALKEVLGPQGVSPAPRG